MRSWVVKQRAIAIDIDLSLRIGIKIRLVEITFDKYSGILVKNATIGGCQVRLDHAVIIREREHVQQFSKLRNLWRGGNSFRHIRQRRHHTVGQMQITILTSHVLVLSLHMDTIHIETTCVPRHPPPFGNHVPIGFRQIYPGKILWRKEYRHSITVICQKRTSFSLKTLPETCLWHVCIRNIRNSVKESR